MKNLKPSLAEATVIREFTSPDLSFIVNSWSNQIKKHPPFSMWGDEEFREHTKTYVVPLVRRGKVLILADKIMPDLILSWICGSTLDGQGVLHFGYTKSNHRGLGYFSALYSLVFENKPVVCTEWTPNMARHIANWNYRPDPYITHRCL